MSAISKSFLQFFIFIFRYTSTFPPDKSNQKQATGLEVQEADNFRHVQLGNMCEHF